jgi:hypothetical protein
MIKTKKLPVSLVSYPNALDYKLKGRRVEFIRLKNDHYRIIFTRVLICDEEEKKFHIEQQNGTQLFICRPYSKYCIKSTHLIFSLLVLECMHHALPALKELDVTK